VAKRKTKFADLKQMDILSAMRGSDVAVEEKAEETEEKKTAFLPWDFANDIRKTKTGNLLDTEEGEKAFNAYIVFLFLAAKTNDAYVINYFNGLSSALSKKQIYKGLIELIPKDTKGFYKYNATIKEKLKENIEFVSKYFECSEKESMEFIDILGEDWAVNVKAKFGDEL